MARSLADRLRTHEQLKARLAAQEARLKDAGRKARTRRLIEAGGLIEKAGFLALEPNALYGALLSLREDSLNKDQVAKWTALGGRAFAREARQRDEGKEPCVLTFAAPLAKDATAPLRAAGFRFNKVLRHWEGLARFEDAEALANAHGGSARRVERSAALSSPTTSSSGSMSGSTSRSTSAPASAPMSGPTSAPMSAPMSAPTFGSGPTSRSMSAPASAPMSAPMSAPTSAAAREHAPD